MLLPGIVLPAEPVYGALIEALGPDVEAVAKDLEVYATPEPPQDYSLEVEIEGVLREADAHGWARFHLVGYSGGGAASLALAAARAERLASLALLEPAWAGNWDLSPAEKALWVWMAKRPAGIRAIQGAFKRSDIDGEALRHFDRPVYFALGALSNPDQYGEIAKRLSGVFPDFELEVFDERHHFDPPHRIEPKRLANSLKKLWGRAERSQRSRR